MNTNEPSITLAPNRRPRFPLGGPAEFGYLICAPPSTPAAVGEEQRSAKTKNNGKD
jgi:hypothetical protein